MKQVYKDILDSGATVITERKSYFDSIAIGFWVKTGSANEPSDINGISHFIEHMLFKGTKKRSYLDIDKEIDIMGGALNAFTGNELTCFYTKVLAKNYERAIDLLTDIMFNSLFSASEIEKEKLVVFQEIMGAQDDPYDYVHDLFHKDFYGNSFYGNPILGTAETIQGFDRDKIIKYFNEYYIPNNIIVSVAGNIDHNKVVESIDKFIKKFYKENNKTELNNGSVNNSAIPDNLGNLNGANKKISKNYGEFFHSKELEQIHFVIGFDGIKRTDKEYYVMEIFNTVLGGSVSSRLFQEVREKKGLAYSIYSNSVFHKTDGYLSIYAGVANDKFNTAKDVILDIVNELAENKISADDILNAKKHVSDSFLLGLESSSNLMTRNALNEIYYKKYISKNQVLKKIEAVNEDLIFNMIEKIYSGKRNVLITVLGKDNN
ncbi:MAG: M16 family metallopeptidase [bacterium]